MKLKLQPGADPNHLLALARSGDAVAREELIRRYTPFILSVVSRTTGHFIRLGEDDEASIGLMAFNEAIDNYRLEGGATFLTLAETVIRRRLIDYFRREGRHRQVLSLQAMEGETAAAVDPVARDEINMVDELADRREEIERYQKELASYGITLKDLVKCSPQHRDARDRALAAARVVVANPLLRKYLLERKALPLKALEKEVETSRKTLERHRKYIIAAVVMLMGNYEYLAGYIGQDRRGGQDGRR
ncbi:RNA polymerase sigma factor SigI [Neomoorella thermoacetica]|uniref:RNA polymerase sigma factor SigI n=1 Tax=Moorella thermoacetica Y72 TaxID=1325331 RepID=A0A0S6U6R3_NEOTH|nr:RNA polymerase sigma factor SigI [Moorella thermoacetica]GAF24823.1 DNA-directed RNA polymerase specialized sigma subunit [Moorella thermoacetica Y72]